MDLKAKIAVIGLGNIGKAILKELKMENINGVEFIYIDTNKNNIEKNNSDIIIDENDKNVMEHLDNADVVFIISDTDAGCSIASKIARQAKEKGALTLSIVPRPLYFNNRGDGTNTELDELRSSSDSLMLIKGSKPDDSANKKMTIDDAVDACGRKIGIVIKGIVDVINEVGLISLDLADVTSVLKDSGEATLAIGETIGIGKEDNIRQMLWQVISSGKNFKDCNKGLLSIYVNSSFVLGEIEPLIESYKELTKASFDDIIFGLTLDDAIGKKIRIIAIGV